MSATIEHYNVAQLGGHGLSVIQCGITRCDPGHSIGPVVYPNYALHLNLKGKCSYCVNGMTYELSPGQGFIIFPYQANTYVSDTEDPCTHFYVIFSGSHAANLIRNAGLSFQNVMFSIDMNEPFLNLVQALFEACKKDAALSYDVVGYLMVIMSHLIAKAEKQKQDSTTSDDYVAKALSFIEQHYPYSLTVSDIATYVKIDRTYLYKLFMKEFGMSPQQYLCDFRLTKAAELIKKDELSLNKIALLTGFYDYSYFSKAFQKKYHVMPGAYRNPRSV